MMRWLVLASLVYAATAGAQAPSGKNLVVEKLTTTPTTAPPGGTVTLKYRIYNRGNQLVKEPPDLYTDRLYLSADTFLDDGDVLLGTSHGHTESLSPGEAHAHSQAMTVPTYTTPGSYYLIVETDAFRRVAEFNENDNVTVVPFTVGNLSHSQLWGVNGESWDTHRLPDVSRVGYHGGDDPLPSPPVTKDLKEDFGAIGDGRADDIAAFRAAVAKPGVVAMPPGRYYLTDALNISRSNVVLRGAGPEQTILVFSIPVRDSTSRCRKEGGGGGWWLGGMICVGVTAGVEEIGLEGFSIEFESPGSKKTWHLSTNGRTVHKEVGWNGITYARGVSHSWIRNVTITDTDDGHVLQGHNITATGLVFKGRVRSGEISHHAISVENGAHHNLITNFVFEQTARHDITVTTGAHHNVFSQGRGKDIAFDHHGEGPHDNVFTDIDIGRGTRPWLSGGNESRTPPWSGPRATFWNVRDNVGRGLNSVPGFGYSTRPSDWPVAELVNIVGARFTRITPDLEWVEGLDPATLTPQDIHEAQLMRRLGIP